MAADIRHKIGGDAGPQGKHVVEIAASLFQGFEIHREMGFGAIFGPHQDSLLGIAQLVEPDPPLLRHQSAVSLPNAQNGRAREPGLLPHERAWQI